VTKTIRTTIATAAIVGAALVLTACGSPEIVAGPSSTAPVAEQPSVGVSAAPSSSPAPAPTPDVDAGQAAWEKLDVAISTGNIATATALTAPGSAAAIYATTAAAVAHANPSQPNPRTDANGNVVKLGGPITVDPAGLITDLTRNGIPVSQSIAGPSGEALSVDANTRDYSTFTGSATAKVLGYRWFDGNLQIIFDVTNSSDGKVYVQGSSYVSGGQQFDVTSDGTFTAPGVTRASMLIVKGVPAGQGGTLNAQVSVDFQGDDATITVPSMPGH
jgi:hypothetical protein